MASDRADTSQLKVDPDRVGLPMTADIYVRAYDIGGEIRTVLVSELDLPSLMAWLRSRGGENRFAEQAFCILLGHPPQDIASAYGLLVFLDD